ncbi:transcription activator of gluconeogenesis Ert1p [[Candida] jaroonii]|uniref:Transcription activator of gluconeogenesis Ert1p n=1 Tax=[Candida] jaroonii TaxID=467808 RepID=A0ACA9Y004_9ASCO|nr:transcription activator of gluconeogenesis Ert1p [[Candida] jaroonii]
MSVKAEDLKISESVEDSNGKPKPQKRKKKKVEMACVYCRRSHMICDDSRPCQRCIKRGIGHLCYDEPTNSRQRKKAQSLAKSSSSPVGSAESPPLQPQHSSSFQSNQFDNNMVSSNLGLQNMSPSQSSPPQSNVLQPTQQMTQGSPIQTSNKLVNKSVLSQTMPFNPEPFFYSEHAGSEFSSLNDFLSMIDDPDLVNGALNDDTPTNDPLLNFGIPTDNITQNSKDQNLNNILSFSPSISQFGQFKAPNTKEQMTNTERPYISQPVQQTPVQIQPPAVEQESQPPQDGDKSFDEPHQPVISDSARDKFFLTAADPTTEISPEERLKQVIKAKLEAGLLQPYNYAKGYARLQNYMDNYMNITSRQRILKPLSVFRPAFRAIARTLKDVDLVLVEESFERMLLDYDRVFTSMAIPACLWRRTGEIYRGNKEFASLVGVTTDDLKDGKLAIYELMSEESAVNFWEKYGAIAFDKGQKAVLTSCNLRTKDGIKRKSCCFSFTIRRDRYNIPSCIVGNFIPIDP